MNTIGLTYEQKSIIDAVLTLINNMDEKMKAVLLKKLTSNNKKEESSKVATKHPWMNYPISDEVMSMTFKNRKPINGDYKATLEEELQKKYL